MKGHNRQRYLTEAQLNQLIKAARKSRYGQRDSTLILIMARHGLRVTEAVDLRWDQVDFAKGHLHARRLKTELIVCTRFKVTNSGPCVSLGALRNRNRPLCSPPSVAAR